MTTIYLPSMRHPVFTFYSFQRKEPKSQSETTFKNYSLRTPPPESNDRPGKTEAPSGHCSHRFRCTVPSPHSGCQIT